MISNGRSKKVLPQLARLTIITFQRLPLPLLKRVQTLSANTYGWWVNTVAHQYLISTWQQLTFTNTVTFLVGFFYQVHLGHNSFLNFLEVPPNHFLDVNWSLNDFCKHDKRESARSFLPFSFCVYVIIKSSSSLLILLCEMNYKISKLLRWCYFMWLFYGWRFITWYVCGPRFMFLPDCLHTYFSFWRAHFLHIRIIGTKENIWITFGDIFQGALVIILSICKNTLGYHFLFTICSLQFSNALLLIILHCNGSSLSHFDCFLSSRPNEVFLLYLILYWRHQQHSDETFMSWKQSSVCQTISNKIHFAKRAYVCEEDWHSPAESIICLYIGCFVHWYNFV